MGRTKIEWAEKVWNPVTGCTKISPGCAHCYAERMAKRLAGRCGYPAEDPFRVTLHSDKLDEPLRWKKPARIFVCSMADLFHNDVPDDYILEVFNTMANAQFFFGHKFMVLTKRPERMKKIMEMIEQDIMEQRKPVRLENGKTRHKLTFTFPLQNIWLGVTAENQEQADKRIPILLQTPAAVRFVSVEPMLGPVDLEYPESLFPGGPRYCCNGVDCGCRAMPIDPPLIYGINWVICGGESGPGARPMHPDWARSLRDQCQAAGVPYMFKQWGEWQEGSFWQKPGATYWMLNDGTLLKPEEAPGERIHNWSQYHACAIAKVGKKAAGRLLDGELWDQYPVPQ